jgi:hypothetical protein
VDSYKVGVVAGLFLLCAAPATASPAPRLIRPATDATPAAAPSAIETRSYDIAHPWIEGVDPTMENRLFYATYGALRSHNVLKVYGFAADGYQSAGIRFSGRVPHDRSDLPLPELTREAATLIRTTFDRFPQLSEVDVWATIPVAPRDQTSTESTVFSVCADRATYERIAARTDLSDAQFLAAFGPVWVAPEVPR